MRKLNTADVFAVARFIRASGMRNQLLPVIRQAAEEAKTIGRGIVAASAAGVIKVVSILIMGSCGLCAAFALLGGLFKSWEWSITSVVFSFAVQMLLAGAVVAALTAAVLLAQSVLCACVRKDYLRYLNGR